MKTIFLLLCLASAVIAAAQQKDVFDIQQHLQKKQSTPPRIAELKMPFDNGSRQNIYSLPDQTQVIINPAYRMPVVTTDMKQFQVMPNAGKDFLITELFIAGRQELLPKENALLQQGNFLELFNKAR